MRAFRHQGLIARRSVAETSLARLFSELQCGRFVQGDVIRLITLDLVLRAVRAGVVNIAFVLDIPQMRFDDCSTDTPSF